MVAAELGIGVDDVRVMQGDTDLCPYGYGNFSSRSLTVGGAAAVLAARDVRGTLVQAGASLLKARVADCGLADGHLVDAVTGERLPLRDVVNAVMTLGGAGMGIDERQLESTRTYAPENIHLVRTSWVESRSTRPMPTRRTLPQWRWTKRPGWCRCCRMRACTTAAPWSTRCSCAASSSAPSRWGSAARCGRSRSTARTADCAVTRSSATSCPGPRSALDRDPVTTDSLPVHAARGQGRRRERGRGRGQRGRERGQRRLAPAGRAGAPDAAQRSATAARDQRRGGAAVIRTALRYHIPTTSTRPPRCCTPTRSERPCSAVEPCSCRA